MPYTCHQAIYRRFCWCAVVENGLVYTESMPLTCIVHTYDNGNVRRSSPPIMDNSLSIMVKSRIQNRGLSVVQALGRGPFPEGKQMGVCVHQAANEEKAEK
jgi:hypothetical protein